MSLWNKLFGVTESPKTGLPEKESPQTSGSSNPPSSTIHEAGCPAPGNILKQSGYWQCQGCGAICAKDKLSIAEFFLSTASTVMGGRTCEVCGTRHEVADISSGKFDMHAPDTLIASAMQDRKNSMWDASARVWKYKRQPLPGSKSFESLDHARPSNVRHERSSEGKIVASSLSVDKYHLEHRDATEVDDLLALIGAQIRESGSFRPCMLSFVGFDNDPRAICQIPEIRRWCAEVWSKQPAIVPLLEQKISGVSKMFMLCLMNVEVKQVDRHSSSFAGSRDEYKAIVMKALLSATELLLSCGYQNAKGYLLEWGKSVMEKAE